MDLTAIAWVAMVAAAAGSLGCVLTARPTTVGSVVSGVALLIAMVDMAVGHVLLLPIAWAAVLLALGVFVVAPFAAGGCDRRDGFALVAAAVIMFCSPGAQPAASAAGHTHLSQPSADPGALGTLVVVAYVIAALAGRRPSRTDLTQVLLTAGCLTLMAAVAG